MIVQGFFSAGLPHTVQEAAHEREELTGIRSTGRSCRRG